jgi:hypothetical protein
MDSLVVLQPLLVSSTVKGAMTVESAPTLEDSDPVVEGDGWGTLVTESLAALTIGEMQEEQGEDSKLDVPDSLEFPWWSRNVCGYHDRFVQPYSLTLAHISTSTVTTTASTSTTTKSSGGVGGCGGRSRGGMGNGSYRPPSVTVNVKQAPVASAKHAAGRDAMATGSTVTNYVYMLACPAGSLSFLAAVLPAFAPYRYFHTHHLMASFAPQVWDTAIILAQHVFHNHTGGGRCLELGSGRFLSCF